MNKNNKKNLNGQATAFKNQAKALNEKVRLLKATARPKNGKGSFLRL